MESISKIIVTLLFLSYHTGWLVYADEYTPTESEGLCQDRDNGTFYRLKKNGDEDSFGCLNYQLHGNYRQYRPFDNQYYLIEDSFYQHGVLEGPSRSWTVPPYEDFRTDYFYYVAGLKHGTCWSLNKSKENSDLILWQGTFNMDEILYETRYLIHKDPDTGEREIEILSEQAYRNGLPHGPYEDTRGGQAVIRGQLVDGKKDGFWEAYDPEGFLIDQCTYENGDLVSYEDADCRKKNPQAFCAIGLFEAGCATHLFEYESQQELEKQKEIQRQQEEFERQLNFIQKIFNVIGQSYFSKKIPSLRNMRIKHAEYCQRIAYEDWTPKKAATCIRIFIVASVEILLYPDR